MGRETAAMKWPKRPFQLFDADSKRVIYASVRCVPTRVRTVENTEFQTSPG